MKTPTVTESNDLEADIERYVKDGFRLDMVMPADDPREVLLSKNGSVVRLHSNKTERSDGHSDWIIGRAGMEYRDLVPDRLAGKMIASHIRIKGGGPVADYVHYHKVNFQMIYCLAGRIRVVYENQGDPFWLEPGDCVLQPPEIRHRVLEAGAGSEVIEITSPAEHETWTDHDLELPNDITHLGRTFSGQEFVRGHAARANWTEVSDRTLLKRDLGIKRATDGHYEVFAVRADRFETATFDIPRNRALFVFVLRGRAEVDSTAIGSYECITLQGIASISVAFNNGFEGLFTILDLDTNIQ